MKKQEFSLNYKLPDGVVPYRIDEATNFPYVRGWSSLAYTPNKFLTSEELDYKRAYNKNRLIRRKLGLTKTTKHRNNCSKYTKTQREIATKRNKIKSHINFCIKNYKYFNIPDQNPNFVPKDFSDWTFKCKERLKILFLLIFYPDKCKDLLSSLQDKELELNEQNDYSQ